MKKFCFIDASNLRHSEKRNYRVDFEKLQSYFSEKYGITDFFYFGALEIEQYYQDFSYLESDFLDLKFIDLIKHDLSEKNYQEYSFIKKLEKLDFKLFLKPLKILQNGKKKGDCDILIALEALKNVDSFNDFLLISGDGDLLPLLRFLETSGKKVNLASFSDNVAKELRQFFSWRFINLSMLKNKLGK